MNVMQNELDALRALAGRCKAEAQQAHRAPSVLAGDMLEQLQRDLAQMETRLEQAGAQRPAQVPQPQSVPLELLDTPANRRYAERLREAWEAGLAVDRERYGPNIGTDGCAQMVEMLLADVEEEISGPAHDKSRVG